MGKSSENNLETMMASETLSAPFTMLHEPLYILDTNVINCTPIEVKEPLLSPSPLSFYKK